MALVRSEPGADSTVAVAPTTLKLYWTQSPRIDVTQVRLWSAANQRITLAAPKLSEANRLVLEVPVTGQMADGVYTVTWRTAGDDGHIQNGTYKFTFRADR
jgi:methionine-rich copper-binding protein CopC